ncbi:MAG: nitroreductase [Saprospiraceae bacterium]|nr:nitroreductase [Saprospiraceae bacterium]
MNIENLNKLIRGRRSVYPPNYKDQPIPDSLIRTVLENANWAPTHKMTEPWRFVVIRKDKLPGLSQFIGNYYTTQHPGDSFSEKRYQKMTGNILGSGCIIAIGIKRDLSEVLPEWEEIAAVAMAVQNMWLTCTALGVGSYWGTSAAALSAVDYVGFEKGVRCLGFFYMGYLNEEHNQPGNRSSVENKVIWL